MKIVLKYISSIFFSFLLFSLFSACQKPDLGNYVDLTPNYHFGDDGTAWVPVGDAFNGTCFDLIVFRDSLWLAGDFTYIGGNGPTEGCAKWNGCGYTQINYYYDGSGFKKYAIHNNTLFAGESIYPFYCEYWAGNYWTCYPSYCTTGEVLALQSFNGELYVGGRFISDNNYTYNHIAVYSKTGYQPLGNGLDSTVRAITAFNGEIYAAGDFTKSGSTVVNHIAKWDGTAWVSLGNGTNGNVNALAVYNNELYATGYFTHAGTINANGIAKWNGANWSALGTGLFSAGGMCLYPASSGLCVGGWFPSAGGVTSKNIAKWNGATWQAMGKGINNTVTAISFFHGQYYAGTYPDNNNNGYLMRFQ